MNIIIALVLHALVLVIGMVLCCVYLAGVIRKAAEKLEEQDKQQQEPYPNADQNNYNR